MLDLNAYSASARLRLVPQILAPLARRIGLRFLSLLFLVILIVRPSFGQQFATLNLTIDDPSGSVIAQARVSVRNVDTGVLRTGVSDKLGIVVVPGLSAGSYTLTVDADSFSTYQAPLTLTLGQVEDLKIPMRIKAATEQVVVHDTASEVETERSERSQVINPAQISDLPIAERDFIDFALLTPTATIGRSTTTAAQSAFQETVLMISFGGLRETHSAFYGLDGIDYTTTVSGVQRVSPSLDWVQ